ncbi:MAG: phage protein Gp37 [bacterium]
MYSIDEIEDAIITALGPLKTSLGVRTIKTYSGELEKTDFKKMLDPLPAIYVAYGGSGIEDHEIRQIEHPTFYIFVLDSNLRTEEESRRGGLHNPGTYAMLKGVRELLINRSLGLEIAPFVLSREEVVGFVDGTSIYVAHYRTFQAFLAPFS